MYVSELFHYPIKSLAGHSLSRMVIDELGPEGDRRFMLVDDAGKFVSQRTHPIMAHIHVEFSDDFLILNHFASDRCVSISLSDDISHGSLDVNIWGDTVNAKLVSPQLDNWLSELLDKSVRLVTLNSMTSRLIDTGFNPNNKHVSFADGFPFLITTQASLDFINQQLPFKVGMERFRPNIVISGDFPAFDEDRWQSVQINGIQFDIVKPCSRCVIPSINPDSLEKQREVTQVLKQFRKTDMGLIFGQNAIHSGAGVIEKGTDIKVTYYQ